MKNLAIDRLLHTLPPRKQAVAVLFIKFLQKKNPKQLYFWTPQWQKWEREAEEDIRAGRVTGPFNTAEDVIRSLEA